MPGEGNSRGNYIEGWRRAVTALCLCGGLWLAFLTSLDPMVAVQMVDSVKSKTGAAGDIIALHGPAWEELYSQVSAALQGRKDARLGDRLGDYNSKVYFLAADPPFQGTLPDLARGGDVYLRIGGGEETRYLHVFARQYTDNDFRPGIPLTGPPAALVYPYRQYGLLLAAAGLLVYLLLPRPRRGAETLAYPRWRVFLADFLALLLFVPFVALPLFIIGGSVQAVTNYWPLALVFWAFAAGGAYMLTVSAWYAALQIDVLPDRLRRTTYAGQAEYLFADIDYYQPITVLVPGWLIAASWLTLLTGRSLIGAANALLLTSADHHGVRIVCKDGRAANFWFTDQKGSIALPGYERIIKALENSNVPCKDAVLPIKGLGVK